MKKTTNIANRLKLGKLKLETILDITKGINNNLSKKELIGIYKHVLINELKIGKLVLIINSREKWSQELSIDTISTHINVEEDLLDLKKITVVNDPLNGNLADFDVVVPVFHKFKPLAYVLLGDFAGEKIEVSPIIKHLTFIQTITNLIVVAIENKRLFKENLSQIAIKKEMELASEMQSMLFPEELPDNDKLDVAAEYIPHDMIGGDYYDFIQLNSDEIAFCIADVSGKGVPAALLMSNFQASIRALVKRTSSLSELISELNFNILSNANREKFITAFIGKYNSKTRNLQFINAGHNPPILQVGKEFMQLDKGSTILGMFDNLPSITEKNIVVPEGAMLLCYTDGVTEQVDAGNNEFGLKRLQLSLTESRNEPVKNVIKNLLAELDSYRKEVDYSDDIALLGLRFK